MTDHPMTARSGLLPQDVASPLRTTPALRVVPMATDYVRRLRRNRLDDFGNPLSPEPAAGDGYPCRHCLRDREKGAALLLLAYRPFPVAGPFSEVGPVFVCAEDCAAYGETSRLPPLIEARRIAVRPYDADHRIRYGHADIVEGAAAGALIAALLAQPETAYVHLRSALNGCFLFRVERG